MYIAAQHDDSNMVTTLAELGADLNVSDRDDGTPLHISLLH